MFIPSLSSTIILSYCYILMIFFFESSCAYVVDSNELTNNLIDQQFGLNSPSYYGRYVRTTKFPRIGRSVYDSEEIPSLLDANTSSEEDSDNELRLIEQRSVLFPRIGKRAFHNLLWANSRSNPHRMIDAQGRYYTNGYDYNVHQNPSQFVSRYRGKRNAAM
ncbi:unnamed protein product [Adineta steineri]|uniref:Uncharacterized protein n=1 Tax=Adineta steineri TaxID=433720 RepID=A0A815YIM3_9BILA|nr:unnamed protein product [Adineta steineri]CAF1668630.1 unnamed protein product [Adineta steineri]